MPWLMVVSVSMRCEKRTLYKTVCRACELTGTLSPLSAMALAVYLFQFLRSNLTSLFGLLLHSGRLEQSQ